MNKSYTLSAALALATTLTLTVGKAHALEYRCKVKSVTTTYAQQTYVMCDDQINSYSLKSGETGGWASEAAIARFVSVALAAQLSSRSIILFAPNNWATCSGGNCDITGIRLVND